MGEIIGSFKAAVTRQIKLTNKVINGIICQPGYFDHIVRKETSLDMIRKYIENNVLQWHLDHDEPEIIFCNC